MPVTLRPRHNAPHAPFREAVNVYPLVAMATEPSEQAPHGASADPQPVFQEPSPIPHILAEPDPRMPFGEVDPLDATSEETDPLALEIPIDQHAQREPASEDATNGRSQHSTIVADGTTYVVGGAEPANYPGHHHGGAEPANYPGHHHGDIAQMIESNQFLKPIVPKPEPVAEDALEECSIRPLDFGESNLSSRVTDVISHGHMENEMVGNAIPKEPMDGEHNMKVSATGNVCLEPSNVPVKMEFEVDDDDCLGVASGVTCIPDDDGDDDLRKVKDDDGCLGVATGVACTPDDDDDDDDDLRKVKGAFGVPETRLTASTLPPASSADNKLEGPDLQVTTIKDSKYSRAADPTSSQDWSSVFKRYGIKRVEVRIKRLDSGDGSCKGDDLVDTPTRGQYDTTLESDVLVGPKEAGLITRLGAAKSKKGVTSDRSSSLNRQAKPKLNRRGSTLNCLMCNKVFRYGSKLKTHAVKVHGVDRPFECAVCSKRFLQHKALVQHLGVHDGIKMNQCDECGKRFTRKDAMNAHRRRIHSSSHNQSSGNTSAPRRVQCKICSKSLSSKDALRVHYAAHSFERQHACDICDKRFFTKCDVLSHRRTHMEKTHRCEICGTGFARNTTLVKHRRTHTGEKPYKCDVCDERFARQDVFKAHVLQHTNDCPFKCGICTKSFTQRAHLERHVLGCR